jgi:hypothetical protein
MLGDVAGRLGLRSLVLVLVLVEVEAASCKLEAVVAAVQVAWTKAMGGQMVH